MNVIVKKMEFAFCVIFVAFQLYTAFWGNLFGTSQKAVHLGLIMTIIFLGSYFHFADKKHGRVLQVFCLLFAACGVFYGIYNAEIARALTADTTLFTPLMRIVGVSIIFMLIILSWLKVGPLMSIVVAFFVFYAFYGSLFPSLLSHGGMRFDRFVRLVAFTSEGIFGSPLTASSTFIATFIILGALFSVTGVGDYMCRLAGALFGSVRGGPAKVAVVSSALFGSISGSAVANVVGTGTMTIPLMKKTGYEPAFAGAVEATASTGGSIMPPVMGTAAFLMAEFVGCLYWDVVVAAFIPAILYYLAILFQVDLYALRNKLPVIPRNEMPPIRNTLMEIWKLSPMVILVLMIGPLRFTVQKAGIYTIIITIIVSCLSKDTRLNKQKVLQFFSDAAHGCCGVAIATAAAGIIIGSVVGTGLSVRLSSVLVKLAGGEVTLLLVYTMLASLVLGMGLPASACYLLLASLVAPAIVQLGIPIMAAHLFVLYFGIISNVTPPVAMAAYAAAGIANCNPIQCGIKAFKLAVGGFVLPYFFCFNDVLLMNGPWFEVLRCTIGAIIGIYCMACCMEGYIWTAPINFLGRIAMSIAGLCLIAPSFFTDVVGAAIMILVHIYFIMRNKRMTSSNA